MEVKSLSSQPSLTRSCKTGAHFRCDGKPQFAEDMGDNGNSPRNEVLWEEETMGSRHEVINFSQQKATSSR